MTAVEKEFIIIIIFFLNVIIMLKFVCLSVEYTSSFACKGLVSRCRFSY